REAKADRATARRADVSALADQRTALRAKSLGDITPPTGYAIAFHAPSYQLGVDANAVRVDITGAEVGASYAGTISSSGGGTPVAFSGRVGGASFNVPNINCGSLTAGTLTASMRLTDTHHNQGAAVTATATLAAGA